MAVLHPDREKHSIYKDIPCFHGKDFEEFKTKMRANLQNARDPEDMDVEHVLPGLHKWHSAHQNDMQNVNAGLKTLNETMSQGFQSLRSEGNQRDIRLTKNVAKAFYTVAELIDKGFDKVEVDEDMFECADALPPADGRLTGTSEAYLEQQMEDSSLDERGLPTVTPATPTQQPPQQQPTTTVVTPADHQDHSTYRMQAKHLDLSDLYDEWYGLGRFWDDYGGVAGRNKLFKAKWRRHWKKHEQKLHSRTLGVITGIHGYAAKHKVKDEEAVFALEDEFKKRSLPNLVEWFQVNGYLKCQKPRGRKSKKQ